MFHLFCPSVKSKHPPLDLDVLAGKLTQWQQKHNTARKVADAHRHVLLERVIQSMAFENEPVTMNRLQTLLKNPVNR